MISNNHAVNTTAVKLIDASTDVRTIYIHVVGTNSVYLGGSDVTTANGLLTEKTGAPQPIVLPALEELWAVAANSENVRILIPSKHNGA